MLTKSLHTVTAATNVAKLLRDSGRSFPPSGVLLACAALTALGYDTEEYSDPTVQKIIKACAKLLAVRS